MTRRLPPRGRARADLPRAFARRCRAHCLDDRCAPLPGLRRTRSAPAGLRALELAAAIAEHTSAVGIELAAARRPPTAWSESPRRSPRRGSTPSPVPRTQRRCCRGAHAQDASRRSSACGWRTRSPRPRWSTCGRAPAGNDLRPGRCRMAGLRPWRGHRLEGPGRPRAAVLADLVGALHPDVHRDLGGTVGRASRRCSRSGCAPTGTGPITRRTSSAASSRSATASSSRG